MVWATSLHVRLAPAAMPATTGPTSPPTTRPGVDRLNAIIREVVGDREGGIVDLDAWAHRLPQGGEFGATHRLEGRD